MVEVVVVNKSKVGGSSSRCIWPLGCHQLGYRHVIVLLGFFGNFVSYAMRVTISMALIQMVRQPVPGNDSMDPEDSCPYTNDQNISACAASEICMGGDFGWTSDEQALVITSFYWGYLLTQIPAGYLSGHWSPKLLYLMGISVTAVVTLAMPAAAKSMPESCGPLVGLRFIQGLAQGVSYPILSTMYGRWAPPSERTTLLCFSSVGVMAGLVFAFPSCGTIGRAFGWESMFYLTGGLGLAFCIPWAWLAFDSPKEHPHISIMERSYIISAIGAPAMGDRPPSTPWRRIATSVPLLSLMITCWCSDWGFYILLSGVSMYLSGNLHFSLSDNSTLQAIPYALYALLVLSSCQTADKIIARNQLTVSGLRKGATVIGFLLPAIFLLAIPFAGCDKTMIVALMSLAVGGSGMNSLGFYCNFNDISPTYAGLLSAIANTFSTCTGFIGPLVTGMLTAGINGNSRSHWRNVFIVAVVHYCVGAVVFGIFGSGEQQKWDHNHPNSVSPEPLTYQGADQKRTKSVVTNWVPKTVDGRRASNVPPWIKPADVYPGAIVKKREKSLAPPAGAAKEVPLLPVPVAAIVPFPMKGKGYDDDRTQLVSERDTQITVVPV